jgi:predicted DNA-binding transcriptional regulator AlpA
MTISPDEQYLTVKELSGKIKFSQQTIYNMIHKRDFVKGRHYIKPRPKKVLFLWSAVSAWLESPDESLLNPKPMCEETSRITKGLINI